MVPSSGLHVFRSYENGQATSSCPRGVTRTMKNGGQVELLTPASAQLILTIPQGTLAMAFLCGSPMALGFPNTSWSTNENRAGSHYFSVFWKAVQFGLGGQSRCSVSASDTHSTHAQDQRASTGFPRTRLCVCLCVSWGGATERSFPFPDPLNVPRGSLWDPQSLGPLTHDFGLATPMPNPLPLASLNSGNGPFRGRGSLKTEPMWCLLAGWGAGEAVSGPCSGRALLGAGTPLRSRSASSID